MPSSMADDGEEMPEPRSAVEITTAGDTDRYTLAGRIPAMIPLVRSDNGRAQRVSVTFDPGLLAQIDADAAARGWTRSRYLAAAAVRMTTRP